MKIQLILAILLLLCYRTLVKGSEVEVGRAKRNLEYFEQTLTLALKNKRLDAVHFLVSLADLILKDVPSEEVSRLAKRLSKNESTFGEFIHLIERVPFDGQSLLIRDVFNRLAQRPIPEVLPQLTQLSDHFPLVTQRLFDKWLANISHDNRLTLDAFERLIKEDVSLQKAHLRTDSGRYFLLLVRKGLKETPRDLVTKGYWRTGIACFLAEEPTGEEVQNFLASLLDYPLAFTQLFVLKAESIGLTTVAPASTILGKYLQRIIERVKSLEQPRAICQRPDGTTVLLRADIFPPGLAKLEEHTRREVIYSIISWITFIPYDRLPRLRHNERDSLAEIFNQAVKSYCSAYSDLYPGVYVEEPQQLEGETMKKATAII